MAERKAAARPMGVTLPTPVSDSDAFFASETLVVVLHGENTAQTPGPGG